MKKRPLTMKQRLFEQLCLLAIVICVNIACTNPIDPELIIEDEAFDYTNYDKELRAEDFPAEYHQKCDVRQRLAIMKAMEESYEYFERDKADTGGMLFAENVYDLYMQENITVRNALTREPIIDCYDPNDESDRNKFALFTVQHLNRAEYLLILNRGEFTAIYAYLVELDDCLEQLIESFGKDPNLDRRLLPLCVQVLTELYVTNQLCNEVDMARWHNWGPTNEMFEQDSIAKVYYSYLRHNASNWREGSGAQR